jgi:AGZA family xanthine/uracil permease-like MFS transporter
MIAGGYEIAGGKFLYPIVAPVLVTIGSIMLKGVMRIAWDNPTEAIPSFLTLMIMPVTFSITDGIAFGFISYSILKTIKGEMRETSWIIHSCALLFVLRYIFLTG